MGITATMIDTQDPASWQAALQPNTKVNTPPRCMLACMPQGKGPAALVGQATQQPSYLRAGYLLLACSPGQVIYVEVISNPLAEVPDLRAVVAFAQQHGLTSVIDATFASPVNLRPLALGFDVVVHRCGVARGVRGSLSRVGAAVRLSLCRGEMPQQGHWPSPAGRGLPLVNINHSTSTRAWPSGHTPC